jgi:glycosyltransferase involved in cell wall biosynthesis
MVGLLTYEPNLDALGYFTSEVLPIVRRERPDVTLRVVGRYGDGPRIRAIAATDGVDMLGELPDVTDELRRATVAVVPIRFGGGTRIKLLEAFAYGLPAVSTTVGAEGLDVVPGTHLLVAEGPKAFAEACLTLLRDEHARERLAAAARLLYLESYQWSMVRPRIVEVAGRVRTNNRSVGPR